MATTKRHKLKTPQQCIDLAWKHIRAADYSSALKTSRQGLKLWPGDFELKRLHAAVLGDYAEFCPPKGYRRLKRKAVTILRTLTQRLRGRDPIEAHRVMNEFYYHSSQFRKQYMLGCQGTKKLRRYALYSKGVGAAWHAKNLAKSGQPSRAKFWAKRSIKAWETYFKMMPNYYNAYVHYALAHGILDNGDKMERALQKAAKLSGQPNTYREFKEVRKIVQQLKTNR